MKKFVKLYNGLAHPPLSGKSLTGRGFSTFAKSFFRGKKGQCNKPNVMLNLFQHLMPVNPGNKEIPKQLCIQAHSSSLRCGGSLCKVRNDNRVCAFTLAEVLITLVIIGVVAALTIPNLMQKYQEQATVKKVQKFYSNLSNAYKLAVKDNGEIAEWGLTGNDEASTIKIYNILFKPYFKISKNCGGNNAGNCITNTYYKFLNNSTGGSYGVNHNQIYKLLLNDGSAIWFYASTTNRMGIHYDTNGAKMPNQWGKDAFGFTIANNKLFPVGIPGEYGDTSYPSYWFTNGCKTTSTGMGCTAWVIYKGNMDYLHCEGLTWESRSCKDK